LLRETPDWELGSQGDWPAGLGGTGIGTVSRCSKDPEEGNTLPLTPSTEGGTPDIEEGEDDSSFSGAMILCGLEKEKPMIRPRIMACLREIRACL
jgi:hypothetical protein